MAELYWAMPDFCLGVDAPAEMFEFKTGRIETDSVCFKLPHTGLPNLECNLREDGVFLLIAHAGPTARHTEDEGLPEFNFKGLTNLEEGCMNYKLYKEGLLIGNAGYYSFYKVQAKSFSIAWKVTCPYSKRSRYYSFVGNREEKKISLSYALRTL